MTGMQTILLNLWFWPLFLLVTFFGIPLLTIWLLLRSLFSSHRVRMRMFRQMIVCYGRIVLACLFPWVRVVRERKGESVAQPCIYICNHRAASDPFLMAMLEGELIQVVNIWPFKIPILGWFAKWAGYLSVREMPFEVFLQITSNLLREGVSMAAFPEGTRAGEGAMGPFHSSMFRVALETGVPVVPVCISGNQRIPLKGSLRLNPGKIRVRTLSPVTAETYRNWSPFRFKNHVHNLIQNELAKMEEVPA